MGVPTSEVGYTSATTGTRGHEVHKGRVVGGKSFVDYIHSVLTSDRTLLLLLDSPVGDLCVD
jgi:hypothetical protein